LTGAHDPERLFVLLARGRARNVIHMRKHIPFYFQYILVRVSKAKPQRNEKLGQICCNMIK